MTLSRFRVLLPPSETKVVGGESRALNLDSLLLPRLTEHRTEAVSRVVAASQHPDAAQHFKLGPKLVGELEHNRSLTTAPTMPALRRYTGVLYDAIPTDSFDSPHWEYAREHLVIHSALFGPIRATDAIPKYRLSANTVLPKLSVGRFWPSVMDGALEETADWFLDLRAKQYQALAPIRSKPVVHLEIVREEADGVRRALNHFNKQSKGIIVARLLETRPHLTSIDDLAEWFRSQNFRLDRLTVHNWQFISG